jgi:hypothetical protein
LKHCTVTQHLDNTAVGYLALAANTSGNTAMLLWVAKPEMRLQQVLIILRIGDNALTTATTASGNTAIGKSALAVILQPLITRALGIKHSSQTPQVQKIQR